MTFYQRNQIAALPAIISLAINKAQAANEINEICPLQKSLCEEIELLLRAAAVIAKEISNFPEPT